MDAIKFLKEKKRMCDSYEDCVLCGLSFCEDLMIEHPEEAIKIVEKWSEEHPRKTLLQDFLEKYPNAQLDSDETPDLCPSALGYKSCYSCDIYSDDFVMCDCKECWGTYIDEVELIGGNK